MGGLGLDSRRAMHPRVRAFPCGLPTRLVARPAAGGNATIAAHPVRVIRAGLQTRCHQCGSQGRHGMV
nr:hypothetical protein [Candidatus Sigynarchaeum springense]